jgi:hypothetical protein
VSSEVKFTHSDVIEAKHRFPAITFRGEQWDLSHLDAFALRIDPELGFEIDIVILFSCHCFTHSIRHDDRKPNDIPDAEIYDDGSTPRVLSDERYRLSRRLIRSVINSLPERQIRIGDGKQQFFTFEDPNDAVPHQYVVYFEVKRDQRRKKRVLLQVQSAYRFDDIEPMTKRQQNAGKVRFAKLLRAIYLGDVIHA